MSLTAYVEGIGVLGPGLNGWPDTAAILLGQRDYRSTATVLPAPDMLPPAERRRTGRVVKVALGVALEAIAAAEVDATQLPSVFSSSGSGGHICHEICLALAQPAREVSPTRFSNSVHNAPAGYWSIATGTMAEANVLCAFDASFAAGLLDAMAQVAVDRRAVMLVAYDTEYPPPLHAKRPIPDAFGLALVLSPNPTARSLSRLEVDLTERPFDVMKEPLLEVLRASIPAARGLPLLQVLAHRQPGCTIIEYLDVARAELKIEPCH